MTRLATCPVCAAIDCQRHVVTTWQGGSTRAWRRLRAQVLARDGHRCQRCGQPATHADHITPKAAGGTDNLDNLEALCARCNLAKGDAMPITSADADRVATHPQAGAEAAIQPATARAGISDLGAGGAR